MISFIIVSGPDKQWLPLVCHSIENEVPNQDLEIITIHDDSIVISKRYIKNHFYNKKYKVKYTPGHITRKKNDGVKMAKHDTLVIMHDYIMLCDGWMNGWNKFGYHWDIAMNVILNKDDSRFRDWCSFGDPKNPPGWTQYEKFCPNGLYHEGTPKLEDYSYKNPYWYVSGAYMVVKKNVMLEYPLNEELYHMDSEDSEHSLRIRNICKYKMNTESKVKLLRQKDLILGYAV